MSSSSRSWSMSLRAGAVSALIAACAPTNGTLTDSSPAAFTAGTSPAEKKDGAASTSAAEAAAHDDAEVCAKAPSADASRRDLVCYRWRCDGRDGINPATWSGSAATCEAGDLDADAGDRALRMINLHRFLADVNPITSVAAWSGAAQKCALLAHANAELSHEPPRDWKCWSDLGALTSSVSLIANRSAPIAIDAFMQDPANDDTMVHRRWLLSEKLSRVGIGSTDHYSCIIVDGVTLHLDDNTSEPASTDATTNTITNTRGWAAWPPQGPVPMNVFDTETLDEIGWTVQSSADDLDHSSLTVTVSIDGASVANAVAVTHLTPLYGSRSAIRFVPIGWKTEAGHTYSVHIRGGATAIDYVVEPLDC